MLFGHKKWLKATSTSMLPSIINMDPLKLNYSDLIREVTEKATNLDGCEKFYRYRNEKSRGLKKLQELIKTKAKEYFEVEKLKSHTS